MFTVLRTPRTARREQLGNSHSLVELSLELRLSPNWLNYLVTTSVKLLLDEKQSIMKWQLPQHFICFRWPLFMLQQWLR